MSRGHSCVGTLGTLSGGGCGGGWFSGRGSLGGEHRRRVLRRWGRWTRREVGVDAAEFVRGHLVVREVKLGEEHLEFPLLQAEAGVRGEDRRELGPAVVDGWTDDR